jgi:N-acetylglucosamine-6-phosphate deacetylase
MGDAIIAPAFIDLQIYGAHGKLLSAYPETDSLEKLYTYCIAGGAAHFIPTVATNTKEVFYKSIDAVRDYWAAGGKGVLGIHLEGPWLNSIKRGAHVESLIYSPSVQEVQELLAYGKGVIKMITLAPEICSDEVIALILSSQIVISVGHSNATYDEAKVAFRKGVQTATHLYNAMSPLQHRSAGLVGAILDDNKVMASIIPDGYHVDYAAIRIAKACMKKRLFVITDAVTETAIGPYQHHLAGDKYEAANILSGSALTMYKAVQNLVQHCNIDLGEAINMCSLYPAKLMNLDKELGKIEVGYQAALIGIDEEKNFCEILK